MAHGRPAAPGGCQSSAQITAGCLRRGWSGTRSCACAPAWSRGRTAQSCAGRGARQELLCCKRFGGACCPCRLITAQVGEPAACASMHFVGSSRMSATPLRMARHPSVGMGTCQASPGAQSLQAMPPTCASSCCARPPRSWTQAAPTASGGTRPPAPAQGGRQGGAGQVRCSLASRQ